MGGIRHLTANRFVEIDTDGGDGETANFPTTACLLYADADLWQKSVKAISKGQRVIEEDEPDPTGRRKRARPDTTRVMHGTVQLIQEDVALERNCCSNCGTDGSVQSDGRAIWCVVCWNRSNVFAGGMKAPSEQQIIEACARARAG